MSNMTPNWAKLREFSFLLILAATVCLTCVGLAPAYSHHLEGMDDPDFQAALTLWLSGDEERAIPAFAALSHNDNAASQLLLGLIDKTAAIQGPLIASLSREERVTLLRSKGGMSGQNWVHAAAKTAVIARNWVSLWQMRGGVEIARSFAQNEEPRAARVALMAEMNRRGTGFAPSLMSEAWYPDSMRHLTRSRTLSPDEVADLHPGNPTRKLAGLPLHDADLRNWLQETPLAMHLRAACDRHCPETTADCVLALYKGFNSYDALLVIGSPSARLVPELNFAQSTRGIQSVARHIMVRHTARTRDVMLRQLSEVDECTVSWLEDEFRRYAPSARNGYIAGE
ncbi:hypothetical protein [Roseinatronobacter bogoriensis]|uniref:Uncharacterized protein n=1 Tax=Roseinatronobacter bogoriensis subsp. barguzinensis TaxID=441209 RepID=A0A2K8KBA2_9RHOB|nr:hypothetical protein [Rhodobaca]ATX66266.1 hypothetical protein BG454_10960 [Rhodobaca barguzinensis]MBB4207388.1 hypothetical protein [Rhodobaca bogoriensis DSM 18756]TDW40305.1 hypothetical protein LY39_01339 [Rhodobaca barguzinensis]TDY70543.1 hypothetical protein EV660_102218 [Rhodobaca bogoriensis DSM 18756]